MQKRLPFLTVAGPWTLMGDATQPMHYCSNTNRLRKSALRCVAKGLTLTVEALNIQCRPLSAEQ